MDATESQLADLRHRLRTDFPFYAQAVLKVLDNQILVPFVLRPSQLRLYRALDEQRQRGMPMRAAVLKARKLGFSTMGQGMLVQRTTLKPLHRSIIVAHDSSTAGAIIEMSEVMYRNLPELADPELVLKPPIANRRRHKELRFGTPDHASRFNKVKLGGDQSSLLVDTAASFEAGRGHTYHSVHASEVAFWTNLSKKLASLMNAVPSDDPDTLMIFETTANGFNDFKAFWDRAVAGDNEFVPFFAAWHEDPRYQRQMTALEVDRFRVSDHEFGEAEPHLIEEFDLSIEQLAWRRWAIENLTQSDLSLFKQEYPSFPEEAFLTTGQTVFGGVLIAKTLHALRDRPQPRRLTLAPGTTSVRQTRRGTIRVPTTVKIEPDGPWEIFRPPQPGHHYVVACDPATGEGDAAFAIQVIDHETREQAAQLEIKTEPDLVAEQLLLACVWYGITRRPWLAVERTGGYGLAIIDTLYHEYGYKQMYTRRKADSPTGNFTDRLGWDTTKSTKSLLHDEAMTLMREGSHGLNSPKVARQMETYVRLGSGRTGPIKGAVSDLLLAWMIAQTVASEKAVRPPKSERRISRKPIRYRVAGY